MPYFFIHFNKFVMHVSKYFIFVHYSFLFVKAPPISINSSFTLLSNSSTSLLTPFVTFNIYSKFVLLFNTTNIPSFYGKRDCFRTALSERLTGRTKETVTFNIWNAYALVVERNGEERTISLNQCEIY